MTPDVLIDRTTGIEAGSEESISQDDDLGRPVRIAWIDSGLAAHGWRQWDDVPNHVDTVETVGMWMGENDRVIAIAGTRSEDNGSWLNIQMIWKPALISKEFLDGRP